MYGATKRRNLETQALRPSTGGESSPGSPEACQQIPESGQHDGAHGHSGRDVPKEPLPYRFPAYFLFLDHVDHTSVVSPQHGGSPFVRFRREVGAAPKQYCHHVRVRVWD